MYIADQICNMIDFLVDNIFVKFGGGGGEGYLFRQVILSLWEQTVHHCSLTCFFTQMKVNF